MPPMTKTTDVALVSNRTIEQNSADVVHVTEVLQLQVDVSDGVFELGLSLTAWGQKVLVCSQVRRTSTQFLPE